MTEGREGGRDGGGERKRVRDGGGREGGREDGWMDGWTDERKRDMVHVFHLFCQHVSDNISSMHINSDQCSNDVTDYM